MKSFLVFCRVLSWGVFCLISSYVICFQLYHVNFSSYVHDNAPYVIGGGEIQVIESLKEALDELFCWFANNQMKANPDKYHLITSSSDEVSRYVENCSIKSSKYGKLFGIKVYDIKI